MTVLAKMSVNDGTTGEYLETVLAVFDDDECEDMDEFDEEYYEEIQECMFDRIHPDNKCHDIVTRLEFVELEEALEGV